MSSASFSILINGAPTGHITPTQVLRQRDQLSSYLFLLCTKRLISLLRSSREDIRVLGIRICKNAHVVNHLLFTNDSIIFCKMKVETNKRVQNLLEIYGLASNQLINIEKKAMIFSKNSLKAFKQEIVTLWQNGRCQQYEKYLGLPSFVGKAKHRSFSEIKNECGRN